MNASAAADADIESRTLRKVWRHSVPIMALVFLTAHLDRVNIGFAALQMNEDLGFSNTVFGFGAGFFAVGYALFAIPSTLLLHRFGARRWIAAIMIAWGLLSASTALVTTAESLLLVRALLGMAEAGFAPGVILFFGEWFPSEYRGRVLGSFLLINPLAFVIGGPVSSLFLSWDGVWGLAGWQWLFVMEALPTLVLAFAVLRLVTDAPTQAHWLTPRERQWLSERLAREHRRISAGVPDLRPVRNTFRKPRVWVLAAANVGMGTAGIGVMFFIPLIIQSTGFSAVGTGFVTALPAIVGGLSLPLWGRWTDRARSRETVVAVACSALALGLLGAAILLPSYWAIAALCLAMAGVNGAAVAFWTLPSAFLIGAGAAAGIAFINIAGNLGVFMGPALLGWTTDQTGTHSAGLMCLAATAAVAAAIMRGSRAGLNASNSR